VVVKARGVVYLEVKEAYRLATRDDMNTIEDKRLAKIASPYIKKTPLQDLIADNTFTLDEAAALIPMNSKSTLVHWLFRHKGEMPEPRYRDIRAGERYIQIRILSIEEIKLIRDIVMFGRDDRRYREFGSAAFQQQRREARREAGDG
jgi:hypothetical protein